MAKLDAYLKGLKQFGATAVLLKSNRNVTLRFADGDRQASQKTSHENLVQIIEEIAPTEEWNKIRGGMNVKFSYETAKGLFGISVTSHGDNWMLKAEDLHAPAIPAAAAMATPQAGDRAGAPSRILLRAPHRCLQSCCGT